jgi:hypothetical protein
MCAYAIESNRTMKNYGVECVQILCGIFSRAI